MQKDKSDKKGSSENYLNHIWLPKDFLTRIFFVKFNEQHNVKFLNPLLVFHLANSIGHLRFSFLFHHFISSRHV